MKPNQFVSSVVFIVLTFARMSQAQTPGNLDTNFVPDTVGGSTDSFWQMALQSNGQVIVTGRETSGFNINGAIYRLNSDGSRDSTLASGQVYGFQSSKIGVSGKPSTRSGARIPLQPGSPLAMSSAGCSRGYCICIRQHRERQPPLSPTPMSSAPPSRFLAERR